MCGTPITLRDGTQVACRHCDLCLRNRTDDLVGRCLAEQAVSHGTFAVTLTYAGDTPKAASLHYADVQNLMKRLRRDGFDVRYIVAGEYGTKKGRAHWHCVLFFKNRVPKVAMETRVEWPYWPHGLVYFQRPDMGGFRYAVKYALKQSGNDGADKALSMSKKPPLGYEFFMTMADDMVGKGLPLHAPQYAFHHARQRQRHLGNVKSRHQPQLGSARAYWLQGRVRDMFVDRYWQGWVDTYGETPPFTEWLWNVYKSRDPALKAMREDWREAEEERKYLAILDAEKAKICLGVLVFRNGKKKSILSAFANRTAELIQGNDTPWPLIGKNDKDGSHVAMQLQDSGLPIWQSKLASEWLLQKWDPLRSLPLGRNVASAGQA